MTEVIKKREYNEPDWGFFVDIEKQENIQNNTTTIIKEIHHHKNYNNFIVISKVVLVYFISISTLTFMCISILFLKAFML